MRIVITVAEPETFERSNASSEICTICNYVHAGHGESILIPQPGRLMDLIKILKEYDIPYHIQDVPSRQGEPSS